MWGEEIIDKRILKCSRVINERLSTIDYNVIGERGKGNVDVLIFRTCALETGKVVFQMGTSCPDSALAAARVVEQDVGAIDINMGCPKVWAQITICPEYCTSICHTTNISGLAELLSYLSYLVFMLFLYQSTFLTVHFTDIILIECRCFVFIYFYHRNSGEINMYGCKLKSAISRFFSM